MTVYFACVTRIPHFGYRTSNMLFVETCRSGTAGFRTTREFARMKSIKKRYILQARERKGALLPVREIEYARVATRLHEEIWEPVEYAEANA